MPRSLTIGVHVGLDPVLQSVCRDLNPTPQTRCMRFMLLPPCAANLLFPSKFWPQIRSSFGDKALQNVSVDA